MGAYKGTEVEKLVASDSVRNLQDAIRMREALNYAMQIIGAYQTEIDSRPDIKEQGFCQGIIFKDVFKCIREILNKEYED